MSQEGRDMITNKQDGYDGYDGYKELARGIILRAVKDFRKYTRTIKKLGIDNPKADKLIKECQKIVKFIKSDWFKVLTDVDSDFFLLQLYKEVGYDERGTGKGDD